MEQTSCIFSGIIQRATGEYTLSGQIGSMRIYGLFYAYPLKEFCDLSTVSEDDNAINKAPYIYIHISFYKTFPLSRRINSCDRYLTNIIAVPVRVVVVKS